MDGTNIENLFARIDKKSLECLLINCNTKKLTLEGLKKIRYVTENKTFEKIKDFDGKKIY